MKTVSVINLKGGVAKTITAVNMAHILTKVHNKRVLLVDNDKQGNPSKMFGLHSYEKQSIADILTVRNINIASVIVPTAYENLHLIPANMKLLKANREVMMDLSRPQHSRLREAFEAIQDKYDYCIIDNAPDINISTINALVTSNVVIIPIKIDKYSLDGLAELKEQIDNTKEDLNPRLKLGGCLITQFYNREVNIQGEELLREQTNFPVYKTHIRRTEKVDESTFYSMPILEYSKTCGAARDYVTFVEEFLSK